MPINRIAFIDESFDDKGRPDPAYVIAAVIVTQDLQKVTNTLNQSLSKTPFHATDSFRSNNTQDVIQALNVAKNSSFEIISVAQKPYKYSQEKARQTCLRVLAQILSANNVDFLVADSRLTPNKTDPQSRNNEDLSTFHNLRESKLVRANLFLRHADDAHQNCLWLPDAYASVTRRHLAGQTPSLWAHRGAQYALLKLDAAGQPILPLIR